MVSATARPWCISGTSLCRGVDQQGQAVAAAFKADHSMTLVAGKVGELPAGFTTVGVLIRPNYYGILLNQCPLRMHLLITGLNTL